MAALPAPSLTSPGHPSGSRLSLSAPWPAVALSYSSPTSRPLLLLTPQHCGTRSPPSLSVHFLFGQLFLLRGFQEAPQPRVWLRRGGYGVREMPRTACSSVFVVGGGWEGWAARHLNTWLLFHSWLCGLQCLAQVPSQAALSTAPLPPQESPCSPQTVLPPPPPSRSYPKAAGTSEHSGPSLETSPRLAP